MSTMPALLAGERGWHFAVLVALAVLRAGATVGGAALAGHLVSGAASDAAGGAAVPAWIWGAAAAAVLVVGLCVFAERVAAEKLGQHYIHQVRVLLFEATLTSERERSTGVTIARSTNDLAAVRNWVAQGIAPLVAGVPLLVLTIGWLAVQDLWLGLAVGVPMVVLIAALLLLARPAYTRAQEVRRRRGRLAAQLADAVQAREPILFSGGARRESRRVDRAGRKVVTASLARARIAGGLRCSAAAAPLLASFGIGLLASSGRVESSSAASALMLAGVLGAQSTELGRVVEFRQNFKAARRILVPILGELTEPSPPEQEQTEREQTEQTAPGAGSLERQAETAPAASPALVLRRWSPEGAQEVLSASPGDRIRLTGEEHELREVFRSLAGVSTVAGVSWLHGRRISEFGSRRRRRLIGFAGAGLRLERGTLLRAVRYRLPERSEEEAREALERVGADVGAWEAELPQGINTTLRHGGTPLSIVQRAQLQLARAVLGEPDLLLLNRIDADLDAPGRRALTELLRDYPGVVVFSGEGLDLPGPVRTCTAPPLLRRSLPAHDDAEAS